MMHCNMDVSARGTLQIFFGGLPSNVLNRQFQPYGTVLQCVCISNFFFSLSHSFPVNHSKMMDLPVCVHDLLIVLILG